MDFLALGIGILLPWVCGYFLLANAQGRFVFGTAENLRQWAYGFFVGYALLYLLLLAAESVIGKVQFLPATAVLLCSLVVLTVRWYRLPRRASSVSPLKPTKVSLAVFVLVGLWLSLHLALAVIEVVHNPVYPWDAWLVWLYRAKAWFYQGELLDVVSLTQWQRAPEKLVYAIEAFHYPRFASVIPLWATISLGRWSETLVGAPALLAGFATMLGLYAQCRIHKLAAPAALAFGYLLLSIPLVGSHLSLAGYADIWMMGFVGLGFIGFICGLWKGDAGQLVIGLVLLGFSLAVKSEGIVWFYLALAMVILVRVPDRWLVLGGVLGLMLIGGAVSTGTSGIDVPILGKLGVVDDKLYLPFVEPQLLQKRDIFDTYIIGMFVHGSWNLLWVLVGILVISLPFSPDRKLARLLGFFLALLAASQWFIFGYTSQGEWATSYTAVNRVLLQVAPVLLFGAAVIWQGFISRSREPAGEGRHLFLGAVMLLAAALTSAAALLYLKSYTQSEPGSGRVFSHSSLRVPMGAGQVDRGVLSLTQYQHGVAIVSTGSTYIAATDLPIVTYQLDTASSEAPELFWRTQERGSEVHTVPVERRGRHQRYMADHPDWTGTITELGIIFRGHGKRASITYLGLKAATLAAVGETVLDDWTAMRPWAQHSVNWLSAGRTGVLLHPHGLVAMWLVASLLLICCFAVLFRKHVRFSFSLGVLLLISWMMLDIRWTGNRVQQVESGLVDWHAGQHLSYINVGRDEEIALLVEAVKSEMAPGAYHPVMVYSPHKLDRFTAFRARYHLLPHSGYVQLGDLSGLPLQQRGYVLALDWVDVGMDLEAQRRQFEGGLGKTLELVWQTERHALFLLKATP